ncbi:hypothetical protein, partial [Brevundimonas sp. MYb46]
MARSPSKPSKPVHVPGQSAGMQEMAAPFVHDAPRARGKAAKEPMFAPVVGPRLVPEQPPAAPDDWV